MELPGGFQDDFWQDFNPIRRHILQFANDVGEICLQRGPDKMRLNNQILETLATQWRELGARLEIFRMVHGSWTMAHGSRLMRERNRFLPWTIDVWLIVWVCKCRVTSEGLSGGPRRNRTPRISKTVRNKQCWVQQTTLDTSLSLHSWGPYLAWACDDQLPHNG